MPTITSAGVGSGLDIDSIISKLMTLERRPLNLIEFRQKSFETQLSDYGKIKSALSTFKSAMSDLGSLDKFRAYTTTSSTEATATAASGTTAAPGTYAITVTQLAQAHKMSSANFANGTTAVGATGTLRVAAGSTTIDVVIDGTNNTLNGIRDAINNSASNTSTGAIATVINVDDGVGGTVSKLVLTSKSTGTANALTVSNVSGTVATALNMATVTGYTAKDAIFSVDGYTVTRASNTVTDALQGMTLTLKAAGSTTLTVANDSATVKKNVQAMVDAYNKLNTTLADLRKGSLKADNTLISIDTQIRNVINTPPTGLVSSVDSLAEAGIKTNRDGSMSLDTSVLDAALAADFTGVAQLFANDNQGYAFRLKDLADDFLNISTGLVKARTDGLDARIKSLKTDRENYEYRLSIIENRYRKQFTTLDALISQMQSTSAFLAQQLQSLPKAGG